GRAAFTRSTTIAYRDCSKQQEYPQLGKTGFFGQQQPNNCLHAAECFCAVS
ncbi:MAG: hypothetical protein ACI9PN_002803, partial [Candidatus Azotimanducaceae bacterium]